MCKGRRENVPRGRCRWLSTSREMSASVCSENVTSYSVMVSDGSVSGVTRDRRIGGLPASMYLLTVSLWIPSSLAILRTDRPASLSPLHCLPALLLQKCQLTGCCDYLQLGHAHIVRNGIAVTFLLAS